jgi:hypothetical protein
MEKQQRRCTGAFRGEEIEAGARRIAVDQIEIIRHARTEHLAAALPIGEVPVAICYGSGVVISGVERLTIHRVVDDHSVPYLTRPAARRGWRASFVAASRACRDV